LPSGVHRPFPVSDLIGRDALMNGRFAPIPAARAKTNLVGSGQALYSALSHVRIFILSTDARCEPLAATELGIFFEEAALDWRE
jgi:hypothetical protein